MPNNLKKVEKCWFYVEMLKQSWLYVETMLIMYVDFSFQHWKIVDVEKVKSDSKCWKSVKRKVESSWINALNANRNNRASVKQLKNVLLLRKMHINVKKSCRRSIIYP